MNLINVGIAFGAGTLSITSPCCLPLLPGYLGYMTGLSGTEMERRRGRPFAAALMFVGGFTAVFAILGASASALGRAVIQNRPGLEHLAGALILATGLLLLLTERSRFLSRSATLGARWSRGQLWSAPLLGAAFAISWTPCIGPVLAGILALAGSSAEVGQGVGLLVVYSLGLGLPFVALSLSAHRVSRWLRPVARRAARVRTGASLVLVLMGGLLIFDRWVPLMAPILRIYARAQWPPV